jgi:hypothetical protein
MAIGPLDPRHVEPAARVLAAGDRRPPPHPAHRPRGAGDPPVVARAVARLVERRRGLAAEDDGEPLALHAARRRGLAAEDDGEPLALHAALVLDGHDGRWGSAPDVGRAAVGPVAIRLRERLDARLADEWIPAACPEHAISDPGDCYPPRRWRSWA